MSKSENVAHTQSLLLLTFLLMAHGLALAQDDRPNFLVIVADEKVRTIFNARRYRGHRALVTVEITTHCRHSATCPGIFGYPGYAAPGGSVRTN